MACRRRGERAVMALLTAMALFGFYGAAGLSSGGPISHQMSVVTVCVIAPLMMLAGCISALRQPAA